jgi:CMP-N-acetylneuraminic acid synthetase
VASDSGRLAGANAIETVMWRVLGLIPARGGSKGVLRKNIRDVAGRPLIWYTVQAAHEATRLSRVIVSTDDDEIAAVAASAGVEVPFMRPAELAQDHTPTLPVIQHAVRTLEDAGDRFDAVCLLQPTNPLRRAEHIDACIALLESSGADAVMTIRRVPDEHNPHWVYFRSADGRLRLATGEDQPITRRQALPPAYHRDGSVYVTRRDIILQGSVYGTHTLGVEVDELAAINIDTEADLVRAAESIRRPLTEA